ncbi:MAG: polymerase, sigma-24 subunit, subfamily [Actinobacteria bacterium]|nr:polymerase, sigma-24 subunit, subfamily [Actinomycetota bacterium]
MTETRLQVAGDTPEERFRALFARHYPAVFRYAGRRLGREEAADAAAEAFTVAWRKISHVPPEPETLPWLYGVARRVVANAERGRHRRERLAARAASEAAETHSGADPAGVLGALQGLRPDDREVLRLAAWEGLGPRELGLALGCSPNAAAIRLHRARRRLEEALDDTEGQP